MENSWTGCLYVPAFPAWALARVDPGTGPMVAAWGGRVVAWSRVPALREVRAGDTVDRVAKLCPAARIRVRDRSVEWAAWDEVLDHLNRETPFILATDPPFALFRTDQVTSLGALAERLGVQIGVATDRSTARFAAVRSADRHMLGVSPRRRRDFLNRFGVERLIELGFPESLGERLRLFGYADLGSMLHLTGRHLEAQFGEDGTRLYGMLHPTVEPPIPMYAPPPAIEVVYEAEESVGPDELTPLVWRLATDAARSLGERRTQRIVLLLDPERSAHARIAGRLLPEPHASADTICRFAVRLLEQVARPDETIDRVTLRLEALRRPSVHQASLFRRRPAVNGAVRRVHRRYPGAILRAVPNPHGLFPEDEVILEVVESP